jgi:DNA-binding MarR family transcriptional regulator
MHDPEIEVQALEIVDLAPRAMRRLFALDIDDPATELPVAQLRLCAILREGPRTMSVLGKELGVSLSATTQLADRLEGSGLVERICEPGDRRVKVLQLTAEGEQMMRARRERRVTCAAEALAQLPPATRDLLLRALRELSA